MSSGSASGSSSPGNPARARYASHASAAGYRIERVQPYDMFPGTEHVETLAVLVRE